MKATIRIIAIILLCVITVSIWSCKKNSDGTGSTDTKTTTAPAITDGTWKRQGFTMYDDPFDTWISDPVNNALPAMSIVFTTDGKFTETYNGGFAGTWALSSDKATLTITGGSGIAGTYGMFLSPLPNSILYLTYPLAGTRYTMERVDFLHP